MTDRTIRLALLEALPMFVERLDKRTVTDKIFPNVAIGFSDTAPIIREQTIKSMVLFSNKLSDKVVNNEVLRHLGKCQTDPEAGIRTNATVCLAKIAPQLTPDMRQKVLASGLARVLKDPFSPARIAGLAGFVATFEYYSAEELASRVLPAVSPLLLDPEKAARDLAFQLLKTISGLLQTAADKMPVTVAPPSVDPMLNSSPTSVSAQAAAASQGASAAEAVSKGTWGDWGLGTASVLPTSTLPNSNSSNFSKPSYGAPNANPVPAASSSSSTWSSSWQGGSESFQPVAATTNSNSFMGSTSLNTISTASAGIGNLFGSSGPSMATSGTMEPARFNTPVSFPPPPSGPTSNSFEFGAPATVPTPMSSPPYNSTMVLKPTTASPSPWESFSSIPASGNQWGDLDSWCKYSFSTFLIIVSIEN
jgi:SCY1-like protein 1